MAETIKLYDLAPSPNNMKAKIALRYKGLAYEMIPVPPQDRSIVVRISGQPLTPVLVHGDRVIFDSAAILRYLDANFPGTPRLFSADYGTMKEIERWERFARADLMEPTGIVFGLLRSGKTDEAEAARASALLHERTASIEARLSESAWLVGDSITAADVTAAPAVYYGCGPTKDDPVTKFFSSHLRLGPERDRTREWVHRVFEYLA